MVYIIMRFSSRSVLVQARLSEVLVRELDKLVERGLYRNRTEALEDAIRHLIERMKSLSDIGFLVSRYLNGKLPPQDVDPLKMVYGDEVARRRMIELYGTDNVDEIMSIMRGR